MESGKRPVVSLLGNLRTAVKKVRFLLSFSATRWILSSIAGRSHAPSAASPRRLSFSLRQPSLLDAEDRRPPAALSGPSRTASLGSTGSVISRTSSAAAAAELSRSASATSSASTGASSSSGDDDIDRRAELFIANFYKHIQMERQVSLQLRYCRGDSMKERTPPRLT